MKRWGVWMLRKATAAIAAVAGLFLATPNVALAACEFQRIVEVPLSMDGLRAHVAAKVNGKDTTFTIDTGAFFSNVSEEAAARLGMRPTSAPFGLQVQGIGGARRDARAVVADDFLFANAQFHRIEFLVGGRVGDPGVAGVIGQNVMGPFDVEYDFANGVMRFFKAKGCGDQNLAYWSGGMALSRIPLDAPGTILQSVKATAKLDGHTIKVMLDTGANLSILSRNAAARAGVQVASEGVSSAGISYGIYGKGQEAYLAPFASFKIGDEEIKNTRLRMADIALPEADMLLGADFFLSHRVLISNSQKKLYFTYNGGPVFRLDQTRPAQQAQAQAPPVPGVATPTASAGALPAVAEPKTGADFQRRGQGFVSRRDYAAAIADFSKAIDLEPQDAGHYHSRAMARLANRQPVLAMADLDQALKYNPADGEALMIRGNLHMGSRDVAGARADFEAAMKLAPDNTNLPIQIGMSYAQALMFEPALQLLDSWVSAHPKDGRMPQVLNARCFTRAMANKELEKALADCDAALKNDKVSTVMASRGLVLLRMGRLDEAIAQYSAAIRLQPRAAPALYGRGLAELKKGARVEGETDVAAATAIAPELPGQYRRYGLAPDGAAAPAKS